MTRDWLSAAVCAGRDEWTSEAARTREQAAAACAACPSLAPCTAFAAPFKWAQCAVAGRVFDTIERPYSKGRKPRIARTGHPRATA